MNSEIENLQFSTNDIALAAFLMAKNARYVGCRSDGSGRYSFIFENGDLCDELKREFLNGAMIKAQELLAKREILISEMRSGNRYGGGR